MQLKDDEVVVFDRDRINKEVMDSPDMKNMGKDMPFDAQRMFMGGFKPIIEA